MMTNGSTQMTTAGIAGLAFVALALASNFIAGISPASDAGPDEIREYLADKRTAILWGAFLGLLPAIPIAWFSAVLAAAMRRASGDWVLPIVLILGIAFVASMAFALRAMTAALIWSEGFIATASDDLITYGWNAAGIMRAAALVGFVVFVGAISLATLRTRFMPVWVGWLAGLAAALSLVGTVSALGAQLGALALPGLLSFFLVVAVVSVMMLTGRVTAGQPEPTPAQAS